MAKRTNYKSEKRSKELEKIRKKEEKKEKRLNKAKEPTDSPHEILEETGESD